MDLKAEVERLEALQGRKPTDERFAQVTAALSNKFEGIQAGALKVLAAWGDPKSLAAIREFLEHACQRKRGWSIRHVAIGALAATVRESDAGWVLDLYFRRPDQLLMHELLPLVLRLPVEAARPRLEAELKSAEWANRHAAVKAIGNMPFLDRTRLLARFMDDPNENVRDSARALVRYVER